LAALEGKNPEIGEKAVLKLLDTLDDFFQLPERNKNDSPIFVIERIHVVKGRGTVVTGNLHQGSLKKGDKIHIAGAGKDIKTVVSGINFIFQFKLRHSPS
jgi:elongation factor Tu